GRNTCDTTMLGARATKSPVPMKRSRRRACVPTWRTRKKVAAAAMEAVSTRACRAPGVEPGVWERPWPRCLPVGLRHDPQPSRPWPLPHGPGPRRYERGFLATFFLAALPAFLATVFFACVFAGDVFALVFFAAAR